MEPIFGIVGVVLGFVLGAFYQEWRDRSARKRLLQQLREEVKANIYMIPQKAATLRSMLAALKERHILPGEAVPFCDAIFSNHYPSIAPFLSQKERSILQVVYSTLGSVDKTMADFEPSVTNAGSIDAQERIMTAFGSKLADLIDALNQQEKLMISFIDGRPIDVFHVDLPYNHVKEANIIKS